MALSERSTPARPRGAVGRVGEVLAWVLILAAVVAVTAAVVVPRLTGATPYAVLTSSMSPSLPEGTLVVVRPVSPDSIGVGSVITYQLRSGEPAVVTHRVVAQAVDGAGGRTWRTRGDANDVADAGWVQASPGQGRGLVCRASPRAGPRLAERAGAPAAGLRCAAALLGYASLMFVGSLRDPASDDAHEAARPARAAS